LNLSRGVAPNPKMLLGRLAEREGELRENRQLTRVDRSKVKGGRKSVHTDTRKMPRGEVIKPTDEGVGTKGGSLSTEKLGSLRGEEKMETARTHANERGRRILEAPGA